MHHQEHFQGTKHIKAIHDVVGHPQNFCCHVNSCMVREAKGSSANP